MTNLLHEIEASPTRQIKHCADLNFTIVADPHEHHVDYTIYDIVGFCEGDTKGVFDSPLWHRIGATSGSDDSATLEGAEPYLHGSVKWDGCSNWLFDEQERCMLHGCSKQDLQRFGDVMALCWDWTAELCPNWIDKKRSSSI